MISGTALGRTLTPAIEDGYFDLTHYDGLNRTVAEWGALGEVPVDRLPTTEAYLACCRLLHLEARLIDSGRLAEWLDLFSEDCVYWLPSDVERRNPAQTVTWEMNDRRRLEERVERLSTGRAYSQAPTTRTTHLYTNIEIMTAGPDHTHALCQFLIQTNLAGRVSQRAGWNGWILRQVGASWKIVLKRIGLQDADLPQDNNSFTL